VTAPRQDYVRSADRPAVLDLGERRSDVRRIARSLPAWAQCIRAGWDEDDLDGEVVLRLLTRQGMASRYDPERGSVSKYLHIACRGILLNALQSMQALRYEHEEIGMRDVTGADTDASTQAVDDAAPEVVESSVDHVHAFARAAVRKGMQGYRLVDIDLEHPKHSDVVKLMTVERSAGILLVVARVYLGAVVAAKLDETPHGRRGAVLNRWAIKLGRSPSTVEAMVVVARKIRSGRYDVEQLVEWASAWRTMRAELGDPKPEIAPTAPDPAMLGDILGDALLTRMRRQLITPDERRAVFVAIVAKIQAAIDDEAAQSPIDVPPQR
jgi:hypothetical protein